MQGRFFFQRTKGSGKQRKCFHLVRKVTHGLKSQKTQMGSWWNGVRSQKKHFKRGCDIQRGRWRRRGSGVSGSGSLRFYAWKYRLIKSKRETSQEPGRRCIENNLTCQQATVLYVPFIQIIFHWSIQEPDFLTFSSSPNWSLWIFSSLLWEEKKNKNKNLRKTKSNLLSQSDFALFSSSWTQVRCAPAETCESKHWMSGCIQQTRCRCRCSRSSSSRGTVKAPPPSLRTVWRVQVPVLLLLGLGSSGETDPQVGKQRWKKRSKQ